MDIKTLRAKTPVSLAQELADTQKQLKDLEFQNSAHQLKQVRQIREIKKTIARLHTLMSSN